MTAVPRALLDVIVWVFLATNFFAVRRLNIRWPISKSPSPRRSLTTLTHLRCSSAYPPTSQSQSWGTLRCVVGPFAQDRDEAQQEEEEEHADSNLRKVTFKRRKKGLRSSTKMDFMRLRNGSYQAWMNLFLLQSSKELKHVFTKHIRGNAVLHWDDDVASLPPHNLMMRLACHLRTWLNSLALSHVWRLALAWHAKNTNCTEQYDRLTSTHFTSCKKTDSIISHKLVNLLDLLMLCTAGCKQTKLNWDWKSSHTSNEHHHQACHSQSNHIPRMLQLSNTCAARTHW
jgi:hypothetical protein